MQANFTLNQYTITTSAAPAAGGSVSCSPNPVDHGSTSTCTITTNSAYTLQGVTGTCGGTLNGNTYTTNAITSACTVQANFIANDIDGDGVDTSDEDLISDASGTGTGDGNGDGTQDSSQGHVTSIADVSGSNMVTLDNTGGYQQTDVRAVNPPADAPRNIRFPYGMFQFTVTGVSNGGTVTMRLFIPKDTRITGYWKKNQTTGRWNDIATNVEHGPAYAPNKTVITFQLTDGGPYDEDGLANGSILDQGGPGFPGTATAVPAVDQRGALLFVILAGLAGLLALRRQQA